MNNVRLERAYKFICENRQGMLKLLYVAAIIILVYVAISLSHDSKNAWPITVLALALLLLYNLPTILEKVKIFRFGKGVIELETITKEAQEATKEAQTTTEALRKLAFVLSKKMAESIARAGTCGGYFRKKELYAFRLELCESFKNLEIGDGIKEAAGAIDRLIISYLFGKLVDEFNDNIKVRTELHKYQERVNIEEAEKYLQGLNLIDKKNQTIIDEMRNYKNSGKFERADFLDNWKEN